MPFIIGVLGEDGEKNVNFRQAMAAPADMPEFRAMLWLSIPLLFGTVISKPQKPKQSKYNEIVGTAHALKADGTLDSERKWDAFWKPIGQPVPAERNWRFITVDATETKDKLLEFTDRRFRDIKLPVGMENWYAPEFDDSQWTTGKAPIGKGVWKHSGITLDKHASTWAKKNSCSCVPLSRSRTSTTIPTAWRFLARQGFHVYLNGHKFTPTSGGKTSRFTDPSSSTKIRLSI